MHEVKGKDIHTQFRDYASISLLIAAFEKSFPLFHSSIQETHVDEGGKLRDVEVFRKLQSFSTDFPQWPVDAKRQ